MSNVYPLSRDYQPAGDAVVVISDGDARETNRTVAPHGVTGAELKRLGNAVWLMQKHCEVAVRKATARSLWWLNTPKGLSRNAIAVIWKRICRLQAKHYLPAYSALTFETRPALHAHIIFIGNDRIVAHLKAAAFGERVHVDPVTDPDGLARNYLAKERTPQAGYCRRDLGGRLKGSHRLDGGGDRVRLSRELERDGIEDGYIEPWQHTNAKRQQTGERKSYRSRKLTKRTLRMAGQLSLFPEIERRPVARLHTFGGGHMPQAVALEIEHRRKRLGVTQRDLASMIGISRGQYANALRGHRPISGWPTNRLRDALLACPGRKNDGGPT